MVRILRNLVKEGISIRDMRTIIESLGELSQMTKDPEQMTDVPRASRAADHARFKSDGVVNAMTLDPRLEQILRPFSPIFPKGVGGALDPNLLRTSRNRRSAAAGFGAHGASPLVP